MTTIEKILALMSERNITANKLQNDCGLSNNAITEWKKGKAKPSEKSASKIADYFDVSVDYLLGRTDDPTPLSKKSSANNGLVIPPILQDPALRGAFHEGFSGLTQRDIDELARMAQLLAEKNRERKE